MKKIIYLTTFVVAFVGMMFVSGVIQASAANITLTVGAKKVVRPAALKKAKKVTIKNSKKAVAKVAYKKNSNDKRFVFKASKPGNTCVNVTIKQKNNKKKKLSYKINVSAATSPIKIDAQYISRGHVAIEWNEIKDVMFYRVERKEPDTDWEKIAITKNTVWLDYTATNDKEYSYRVKARLDDKWTEYSNVVNLSPDAQDTPSASATPLTTSCPEKPVVESNSPDPEPAATDKPLPTYTPYVQKYTYEVELLNKWDVCDFSEEEYPAVLYIKTDNPNPNSDEFGRCIRIDGIKRASDTNYSDINYLEQENTNLTMFNKVAGGWIYTCMPKKIGVNKLTIQEKSIEPEGDIKWHDVYSFEVEVKDGDIALSEYCDKVVAEVSNEKYNVDGLGKWSELDDYNKVMRFLLYIKQHYYYPRIKGKDIMGNIPDNYIQENEGAFWETGYADCGRGNYLLCELAKKIGLEANIHGTNIGDAYHVQSEIVIDGVPTIFDATPNPLHEYPKWDYIL